MVPNMFGKNSYLVVLFSSFLKNSSFEDLLIIPLKLLKVLKLHLM